MLGLNPEPATCPGCGTDCEAIRFGGALRYFCDGCAAAEAARRRHDDRKAECLSLWADIAPAEFQIPVKRERLHPAIAPAMDLDGTEGAGLIGGNGIGKSRAGYLLLKRAAAKCLRPYAITASLYRQSVADRYQNDPAVRGAAVQRLQAARFAGALLLDDVGKGAKSEAGDEALFELLSHRRDNRLVTHWTANGSGEWIATRYGQDRGPAIAIRLAHLAGCFAKGTGRIFNSNASGV